MKENIDYDRIVEEALKHEPAYFLPLGFADRLEAKVKRISMFRAGLSEYSAYAAVFAGLVIFAFAVLFFVNKESFLQLSGFLMKYKLEIISVIFIANFILFADKVLLRMLFLLKQKKLN